MKKITLWGVGAFTAIMFIGAPIAAGAVSIDDLQNQVASLLRQIAAIQGQGQASSGISGSASVSSPIQYRVCTMLNRNLSIGSRGDDVSGLQEFLQGQGYLSVSPTGYFGPITAQAVARWQSSQGVSAVGTFGPLSRGRLMTWCGNGGGGTIGNGILQASPQSGDPPLTVTFTTSIGVNDPVPNIDFGDGQTGAMTKGSCVGITAIQGGQGGIRCSASVTHTYSQNGAYTATLINTSSSMSGKVGISVGGTSQGSLQANPQSGAAPLAVNFTYLPTSESGTYHIDYGDGSSDQMTAQQIQCIRAPCINPAVSSHTYASAGTYTVVVSPYIACLYSNPRCMIAVRMLAKTTVTVTGTGASTCKPITYMPILCSDGTAAQPTHNEEGCIIGYECPVANYTPPSSCKAWNDGCNECGRTSPGAPAACTLRACFAAGKGYCSVYFDNPPASGNKPPVISGLSGPTALAVGATGTWTVNASDPENGTLSYSINWGDQAYAAPMAAGISANNVFVQTTTFTHAYSSVGTYTITVTVKDAAGLTAQTTTNVQVGGSSVVCTADYSPVCGQLPAPTCAAGMMCPMYMPAPKTYSNMCQLNAAGATFLYSGTCSNGL